jgi:hypothetical protein
MHGNLELFEAEVLSTLMNQIVFLEIHEITKLVITGLLFIN